MPGDGELPQAFSPLVGHRDRCG